MSANQAHWYVTNRYLIFLGSVPFMPWNNEESNHKIQTKNGAS